MNLTIFHWRSLKTRVTLFTLVIFLASFWSLTFYASRMLREDMQRLLGEQQFSTVSLLAEEVNQELDDRLRALERVAARVTPAMLANAATMQSLLEQSPVFQGMFNGGIFSTRLDGTAIASMPLAEGRFGVNYRDTDYIAAALRQGQSTLGKPVLGKRSQAAVFAMAVPIRDAQGQVIGALAGVIDLGQPNFLDRFTESSFGKSGAYLIAAPQHQLFVTASDKSRVMRPLPAPGVNPLHDRFATGYEGYGVLVNFRGEEELAASKGIPVAGWFMGIALPTSVAFAPIYAMQQRMQLASLALTLLATVLTWWMLRRQLSPVVAAARTLATRSDARLSAQPLPITSQDEIGDLIGGFNRLLKTLGQREKDLKESEELFRLGFENANIGMCLVDLGGQLLKVNRQMCAIFGYSKAEMEGMNVNHIAHPEGLSLSTTFMAQAERGDADHAEFEKEYIHKQGQRIIGQVSSSLVRNAEGAPICFISHVIDVTERKQAEKSEQFRRRILELLVAGEPLAGLLEAIVLGVEELNPAMLCSLMLLDGKSQKLGKCVAPSLPDFYNAMMDGIDIGLGVGSCGTAAFTGVRVIADDITTNPYWAPYKALAASAGLGACWSQPIRATSGQVLGTFAIYHRQAHTPTVDDISLIEQSASLASVAIEKSLAAEKLRDSEARFRHFFESNSSVMLLIDPASGEIIDANRAAAAYYGYARARLTCMSIRDLNTLSPERIAEERQQALRQERNYFLFPHRLATGEVRDVEVYSTPIESGGRAMLFSIIHDITERKQAEAELRIAAVAFDSQEGMLVTDAEGVILRINRAFTEITGYTSEDAVGQTPRLLASGRHDADFYRAMWATIHGTGGWRGEVWDRRKNGEIYPKWLTISAVKDDQGRVTHYIGTHHDITERKQAEEKIEELAFFDSLTHLPNRTLLLDRLKQAMTAGNRNGTVGAVLFIDLDHFKMLNDTQGHDQGDLLLQQVAQRLAACVREGDTVARLGGDEFVVVLGSLNENLPEAATQTKAVGEKILAALRQPYQLADLDQRSTASVGATLFCGHETSIDDLLKQADLAMYKAKESGRNALRFFDPAMQTSVLARAALEKSLRRALQEQQFVLHYQAQVIGAGRVTGAEVLVRWLHPERGMVPPGEFIPLAEETGLILPLGAWVLETACIQLATWATQAGLADLIISVNVSAHQFREADFVDKVLAVLRQTGACPHLLKLELTESLLVDNVQDIIEKMHALKAHGVGFSLDDFGTGYSSLSYLKRLPLDLLKIDQSFVRDVLSDPNDAAIARTIVALAQSLGLGVIAEGVETAEQRDFLARSGCHAYQGYFFSRPLPVAGFEAFAVLPPRVSW